jgi:hypothetical protein
MEQITALLVGFIIAFAITAGIGFLWGLWSYNSKIRKHLRYRLKGLISLKKSLRRSAGRWILFLFTWASIFALLAAASYFLFGEQLRVALSEGGLKRAILLAMRNTVLTQVLPGEVFRIVPWGLIAITVLGAAVGWLSGTFLAKRQVTKGIHLTSKIA